MDNIKDKVVKEFPVPKIDIDAICIPFNDIDGATTACNAPVKELTYDGVVKAMELMKAECAVLEMKFNWRQTLSYRPFDIWHGIKVMS